MANDKKKQNDNLINFKQKCEFEYALKQVIKQAPDGTTKKDAKEALTEAAKAISPSKGRDKIMKQALKNLKD